MEGGAGISESMQLNKGLIGFCRVAVSERFREVLVLVIVVKGV